MQSSVTWRSERGWPKRQDRSGTHSPDLAEVRNSGRPRDPPTSTHAGFVLPQPQCRMTTSPNGMGRETASSTARRHARNPQAGRGGQSLTVALIIIPTRECAPGPEGRFLSGARVRASLARDLLTRWSGHTTAPRIPRPSRGRLDMKVNLATLRPLAHGIHTAPRDGRRVLDAVQVMDRRRGERPRPRARIRPT